MKIVRNLKQFSNIENRRFSNNTTSKSSSAPTSKEEVRL